MGNEINNLLAEKRNFLQKENYYKSLQKEVWQYLLYAIDEILSGAVLQFDQLSAVCQKQMQDLKSSRARENELSVKLREKVLLLIWKI